MARSRKLAARNISDLFLVSDVVPAAFFLDGNVFATEEEVLTELPVWIRTSCSANSLQLPNLSLASFASIFNTVASSSGAIASPNEASLRLSGSWLR